MGSHGKMAAAGKINSKKELEILLEGIGQFQNPKIRYEQYRLPAQVAAEVLWYISMRHGDIEGKTIVDLGCGTGMLALGSALIGGEYIVGVDIDPSSLADAKRHSKELGVDGTVDFINADVVSLEIKSDVVIQNPPFGVRVREADRAFLIKSLEIAPVVYSIHKGGEKVRRFVSAFVSERGGRVDEILPLKIKLSPTYHFHKKRFHTFQADLFRIVREG